MKIAIGSDHRGAAHRALLAERLAAAGHPVEDCGGAPGAPVDYPVPALAVAERVADGRADLGVLVCGSGIGVSIAANKVRGARAALCFTAAQADGTRRHNDANVLCLSGDALTPAEAWPVVEAFLAGRFEGGRHAGRVQMITGYENRPRAGE
ncbi:RpiB/LacA/LacB family sugar-phosphate isomerase [bacterium]|nr:RpiB/LacA/LacB family sugar-phosphate isomerase [bacterium]